MSFSAFTDNSTPTVKTPPLDLILPEPLTLNSETVTFKASAYPIILHMYNAYILWSDNYIAESETDTIADLRLELCSERLVLKDETIQIIQDDRDHAYDLFKVERNDKGKLEIQNTLKIIGISAGTGLVGVAVGIIIGVFIS